MAWFSGFCYLQTAVKTACALANEHNLSFEDCCKKLQKTYDGYRFHPDGCHVYNPYSLIKAFYDKEFGSYWFETGAPTFLAKKLHDNHFDVRKFSDRTIYASERTLKDYSGESLDLIPLLYQSGYLTISEYNTARNRYTLTFPNEEVKYAFLESLMPEYVPFATAGNEMDIFTLEDYIENGSLEEIKNVLTALFASIPYTL